MTFESGIQLKKRLQHRNKRRKTPLEQAYSHRKLEMKKEGKKLLMIRQAPFRDKESEQKRLG